MNIPRNLTASQRTNLLNGLDVGSIVYCREDYARNVVFQMPSRKFAKDVFNRWFKGNRQGCNFDSNTENSHHRNVSNASMQTAVRDWAQSNTARFKFQIQRSYLLYRNGKNLSGAGRVWRIHWPSHNTRLPIPNETRGGWSQVVDADSLNGALNDIGDADLWGGLNIREGIWNTTFRA